MKNIASYIALICCFSFPKEVYSNKNSDCFFDNYYYIQKNYSFNWQTIAKKTSKTKPVKEFLDNSFALGYAYNLKSYNRVRSELELQYSKVKVYSPVTDREERLNTFNKGRVLLNLYYDQHIYNITGLKIYLGLGMGIIQDIKRLILDFITEADTQQKQNNINLTFQTMLGINYLITSKLEIYGGYRYVSDIYNLHNKLNAKNGITDLLYEQFTNLNINNKHMLSYGGISLGIKYNF